MQTTGIDWSKPVETVEGTAAKVGSTVGWPIWVRIEQVWCAYHENGVPLRTGPRLRNSDVKGPA